MVSRLLRRSGVAVITVAELLDWKPDVVVQVGVGQHHEEADVMREAWPDAVLIGFEPHPDVVRSARKTYPGTVHECAVGDHSGRATLYSKRRHKDGSSLFPHRIHRPDECYTEIDVPIITLDSLLPKWPVYPGVRTLLWLDCEGGELDVLKGGVNFTLGVEMINLEMTANPPGIGWADQVETHGWLGEHGWRRQTTHTTRSAKGQYDAIYVRHHLFKPQYCSCPCQIERGPK